MVYHENDTCEVYICYIYVYGCAPHMSRVEIKLSQLKFFEQKAILNIVVDLVGGLHGGIPAIDAAEEHYKLGLFICIYNYNSVRKIDYI